VKLTDFGIAKASTHNSVFYRVKGKVGYMSPEQARNDPLDHRSDLYSLAVCLYEMITGERLFVHAGLTSTPEQIYGQPIPLLSRKVEGLPADLDKVMLRALSIDPDARYQSAGELQEALLRVAHRHGLLMSAPELAAHLKKIAGPHERWRDLERSEGSHAGGTEVYDMSGGPEGTDQLSVDDLDDDDFGPSIIPPRSQRAKTSITHLSRLQGMELTSMINLAGVEPQGAKPLVDLADLGKRPATPPRPPKPRPDAKTSEPTALVPPLSGLRPGSKGSRVTPRPRPATPDAAESTSIAFDEPRRRWGWLIAALIILAAAAVAAAIGLSGPSVKPAKSEPKTEQRSTP
jgi:serine/threonine protein kinase